MGIFGWSYPPGAANDPNAPYNQEASFDPCDWRENVNALLAAQLPDFTGPGHLYRHVYKSVDCGPTIGVEIAFWNQTETDDYVDIKKLFCGELDSFGQWESEHADCSMILAFFVSSIVEGVDECTDTIRVDVFDMETCKILPDIGPRFWAAVQATDDQAKAIWADTHGCDTCAAHWGAEEGTTCPVWLDCPDCNGAGIVI